MASLTPEKMDLSSINGGEEYLNGDGVQASTINSVIKSTAYTQSLATNPIDYSEAGNVGTPEVLIEETENGAKFVFKNLKGEKGEFAQIPRSSLSVGDYVDNLNGLYIKWENFSGVNYRIDFSSGAYIYANGQTDDPFVTYVVGGEGNTTIYQQSGGTVFSVQNINSTITNMSGSYYDGNDVEFGTLFLLGVEESIVEFVLGLYKGNPVWAKKGSSGGTKLYRHTLTLEGGSNSVTFTMINSRQEPYQYDTNLGINDISTVIADMGNGIYPCDGNDPGVQTHYTSCYRDNSNSNSITLVSGTGVFTTEYYTIDNDIVEEL